MLRLLSLIRHTRTLRAPKGASVTEYAILLAAMAVAIIGAALVAGDSIARVLRGGDAQISQTIASNTPSPTTPPTTPTEPGDNPLILRVRVSPGTTIALDMATPADSLYWTGGWSGITPTAAEIDWGAGGEACPPTQAGPGQPSCTYTAGGTTRIKITGYVARLGNLATSGHIEAVESWGNVGLVSLSYAFANPHASQETFGLPNHLPSSVRDLSKAFANWNHRSIPEAISSWNVSAVTDMNNMFRANQDIPDITGWSPGRVADFWGMFAETGAFAQDISAWETGNARDMGFMFAHASAFQADLSNWDVHNVERFQGMFQNTPLFNADLSQWDVGGARDLSWMFQDTLLFNADLSGWDTTAVDNTNAMFKNAQSFAGDLSAWDVSGVRHMSEMFDHAPLVHGDYGTWRPSSTLQDANAVFRNTQATGDLRCWDVAHMDAPTAFSDGAAITHDPLWGQARDAACSP